MNQAAIEQISTYTVSYLIYSYCYRADNRGEVSESFFSRTLSTRKKKSDCNLPERPQHPER